MRFEAFDRAALALPGAVMDIKWGSDRTYCVGGKMFAHAGPVGDGEPRSLFKASELAFEMLVESGAADPAPYLARAKWVQLKGHDALPDQELIAYLALAHALIAAKLTRKQRAALGVGS
jgi:predicted DNA-binding protein (MmcQ/YjbR family)